MTLIGGPRYVAGPVIPLSHTCGHTSEIHCVETTRKHVEFMESGPCLDCYKAGLGQKDFRPALSLDEVEQQEEPEESGQLTIF